MGLSRNFKGVIQLQLVNETITSKACQDNIKSDIKLQYESRVNILKRYCKVRYLVECLGYCAFILEFYIAIDIILICLTCDCFINKLKVRDPFKSYDIVPSIRLQRFFYPSINVMWINLFVFQTPDGNRLAKEIELECGFI